MVIAWGQLPQPYLLHAKHSHLVTISKEGYRGQTVHLHPHLSAAVAGNIVAGGVIGWGVDAMTGSQNYLSPEAVDVYLCPEGNDPLTRGR